MQQNDTLYELYRRQRPTTTLLLLTRYRAGGTGKAVDATIMAHTKWHIVPFVGLGQLNTA
jgi:hypothetical protein